jgi:hypothetical protein
MSEALLLVEDNPTDENSPSANFPNRASPMKWWWFATAWRPTN